MNGAVRRMHKARGSSGQRLEELECRLADSELCLADTKRRLAETERRLAEALGGLSHGEAPVAGAAR